MASIGHFAQSYITNLYDKQKKKKLPADWGGGGGCPPVVTPLSIAKPAFHQSMDELSSFIHVDNPFN